MTKFHWSRERAVSFFSVTKNMFKTARNAKEEKNIPMIPDSIHGHSLSDALLARVKSFYEDDQISQMCAGKKDCVTVKNSNNTKEHHQKRLIFCNIKEAY